MPGHKCREKCAVCKKHWGKTKTVHVHMGTDKGDKTNFFCTDCLVAGQTEMYNMFSSESGLQMQLASFLVLRPGGTYYTVDPDGLPTVILAVNLAASSVLISGPMHKVNIQPIFDYSDWIFRGPADSEEREYIAAHFSNAY